MARAPLVAAALDALRCELQHNGKECPAQVLFIGSIRAGSMLGSVIFPVAVSARFGLKYLGTVIIERELRMVLNVNRKNSTLTLCS